MTPSILILILILLGLLALAFLVIAVFDEIERRDRVRLYMETFQGVDDMQLIDLVDRLEGDPYRSEYRNAAKKEIIRRSNALDQSPQ
jgi:hypothetical protein